MTKAQALMFTASAAGLATMVGCKPASLGMAVATPSSVALRSDKAAAAAAGTATRAIAARDAVKAVAAAQAAVAAAPRNAADRALLGQAYLLAGRFASAETSFGDAVTLNPGDGRSTVRMALAQIAQNRFDAARATLATAPADTPRADLGLALALSGEGDNAVAILEDAARGPASDARTRQNLALCYALSGDWARARATAAQDVPAGELDHRLLEWASIAGARDGWQPIAKLLDVKPMLIDPGQPAQLALAPAAGETAVAALAPPPVSAPAVPAPAFAAAAPAPDFAAATSAGLPAAAAAFVPAAAPVATGEAADVPPSVDPATPPAVQTMATTQTVRTRIAVATQSVAPAGGGWVVQLGAYADASRVEAGWHGVVGQYQRLNDFVPASTTYSLNSTALHRLSITGFATAAAARKVCVAVKARGGACFIRAAAGDAPLEWAVRAMRERRV